MVSLDAKLSAAVGGPTAKALGTHLELHTVGDLLRHYPRRYVERGALTPFLDLVEGEHATVFAEVQGTTGKRLRPNLYKTDVVIRDAEGARMTLAVFNKPWIEKDLRAGRRAYFSGKAERFNGRMQLANPEFQLVDDEAGVVAEEFAGTLLPIYPAAAKVASLTVQRSVRVALDVVDLGPDPLPDELRARHRLLGLAEALRLIHQPTSYGDVTRAQKRLKWDEAFVLQVVLAQRRAVTRSLAGTPRAPRPGGLLEAFDAALPFSLTAGQQQVGRELAGEMSSSSPMYRLLQGEVGSGKTVVALRAMLQVVDSGGQAALLAPTEVLAQQHARSLRAMLGPLAAAGELGAADVSTRLALLTGSLGAAARRSALAEAASGEAGIVVGTHALLSEGVDFADLGLVVVDEQHRFGVEQRDALRAKGTTPPHVLVMTATPIPRTIAMTVYGDLEVSTLTELPKGRAPIQSAVVPVLDHPQWVDRAWQRVREHVAEGRQAFVVCPRIGGDEVEEPAAGPRPAVAVLDVHAELAQGPLDGLRVQVLHGRMPPDDKDAVMQAFTRGEVDVLVATTVIEVGVDVPNATVMVVLDADRFGVSQLHQLRGRVGRGAHAALCLLVTESESDSPARQRLDAVAATSDGFALSRVDLEQRREGDVLGAAQSGTRSSLRMLQLLRDEDLVVEARVEAVELVELDPMLAGRPALRQAVLDVLDADRADFLEKA
ncbi:MAG: ATP-dependent helicase RecG [Frankiales bacterium]|nr:ATP-dependent helicase RecG [Frankiales bacterium]